MFKNNSTLFLNQIQIIFEDVQLRSTIIYLDANKMNTALYLVSCISVMVGHTVDIQTHRCHWFSSV